MTCYGCRKSGHSMNFCPELCNLVMKGVVHRDNFGWWMLGDGCPIIQAFVGEPLAQGAQRMLGMQSNLITVEEFDELYPLAESNEELEEEEEEVYAVQYRGRDYAYQFFINDNYEPDPMAYPVERLYKTTSQDRERREAGAWPSMQKDSGVYEPVCIGPPASKGLCIPFSPANPGPPRMVEVDTPMFDLSNNEEIIEDAPAKLCAKLRTEKPFANQNHEAAKEPTMPWRAPRISEVQQHVDPLDILDKMLSALVNLKVREIMAVLKEMAQQVQDVIRLKTARKQSNCCSCSSPNLGRSGSCISGHICATNMGPANQGHHDV